MKRILGLVLILSLSFSIISPASAITFGKEITNASEAYPSVVSIWYSENADEDAQFICTGTLIQPRIVLTAAHCVLSTGLYYVQYGADQLFDEMDLLPVSATWKNPRYSAKQMVNDTGLLLLETEIEGAQVTRLPTSAEIKKIQATKGVKYEIVGWGKDQNDDPASYLRKAAVDDQSTVMKKYKGWRNDVWFAVGKWNSKEKVYAGSCNGDSGGPLFATVGSKKIIAGITSWGAEDCETSSPSIYVRLSYYIDTLVKSGIPTLLTNEVKQNRSLPKVVTEPTISGSARPDSIITCNKGTWSDNTESVSIAWSGPGLPYGTTSPIIKLSRVTAESKYICEVTGKNANGVTIRKVTITQSAPPQVVRRPSISNMPTVAVNANVPITCNSGTFNYSNSVSNEWWIGDSYYSEPTSKVGTGNTLEFPASSFTAYGGNYLYCKSVAFGDGGATGTFSSGLVIPIFQKPSSPNTVVTGVNVPGIKLGDVLSCQIRSLLSGESASFVWSFASSSYGNKAQVGMTQNLTLTQSVINAMPNLDKTGNVYNYLHCDATITNTTGSTVGSDYKYFFGLTGVSPTSTPSASPTPTPSASPTPTPSASPTPTYTAELLSANINTTTGYLGVPISGGPVKLNAQIGCAPALLVSSSYTHWGISPTSVDQNVGNGPGSTVWKTQYENQRTITIDAALLSELSGKYLVCKIVHDDARFTGINLQPKGLASLFVPANAPTADTERPVIVAGSGVVEKASVKFGENFTITFRATDNVGIAGIQGIVYRPDSFPVFEGGNGPRISGSSTDGVYRSTLAIPATVNNGGIQNNPVGTYKVYANVQDSASNSSYVGGSYYIYIGTIEVTG